MSVEVETCADAVKRLASPTVTVNQLVEMTGFGRTTIRRQLAKYKLPVKLTPRYQNLRKKREAIVKVPKPAWSPPEQYPSIWHYAKGQTLYTMRGG